jgi:hypothetical protein
MDPASVCNCLAAAPGNDIMVRHDMNYQAPPLGNHAAQAPHNSCENVPRRFDKSNQSDLHTDSLAMDQSTLPTHLPNDSADLTSEFHELQSSFTVNAQEDPVPSLEFAVNAQEDLVAVAYSLATSSTQPMSYSNSGNQLSLELGVGSMLPDVSNHLTDANGDQGTVPQEAQTLTGESFDLLILWDNWLIIWWCLFI